MGTRLMIRTARWCTRHPLRTVAVWLVLVAGVTVAGSLTGIRLVPESGPTLHWFSALGLPVVLGLLVAVLGSVPMALVGYLMLSTVLLAGFGALALVSSRHPTTHLACSILAIIGVLTSMNSVLFAVRRHQEAAGNGQDHCDATQIVAATAGRTALVSGCMVLVSMTGLWFVGNALLRAVAIGAIVVVALSTAAALTLLPALLAMTGVPPRRSWRWELPRPVLTELRSHPMRGATIALPVLAVLVVVGASQVLDQFSGTMMNLLVMLGLGVLVLMVAFRPLLVAAATSLLGLVSPLAVLGLMSWLPWQLPMWAPMVLLVVLFVPSTDIHVLLLHRFRSEALTGMSPRNIVGCGIRHSAGVITGSVVLAAGALLAFGLVTSGVWQGLWWTAAIAVVVDTVLVRILVLPVLLRVAKGGLLWWRPRVLVFNQAV